jgi:hypothetical protein
MVGDTQIKGKHDEVFLSEDNDPGPNAKEDGEQKIFYLWEIPIECADELIEMYLDLGWDEIIDKSGEQDLPSFPFDKEQKDQTKKYDPHNTEIKEIRKCADHECSPEDDHHIDRGGVYDGFNQCVDKELSIWFTGDLLEIGDTH